VRRPLRIVLAVVSAATLCFIVDKVNRNYLRYIVGIPGTPADEYEVFVLFITRIAPAIFAATTFTLYHALKRPREWTRGTIVAVAIGLLLAVVSFAADIVFMPRARFH
jgi:hypothetical protein